MAKALTVAERFTRGEAALAEARRLAAQVTEDTPGRVRGGLIIRVRSQYHAAYSALGRLLNRRSVDPADRRRAERLLHDCEHELERARRFSR